MQNRVMAKVGAFFLRKQYSIVLFLISIAFILSGCASSAVSRDAASNIDRGVQNAKNLGNGETNIADSYQNSSQTAKGAMLGTAAGAVTGLAYSSIGFFPFTITGAILGASYGAYIDANTTLSDKLVNRGGTVVVLGDQIMVVFPSSRIFTPWTSHIKQQAYSTLNLITEYLNSYTKMLVKISVYTDDSGSTGGDLALSQQQAQHLEKFLLMNGLDARLLYAEGYGSSHLVVKSTDEWDNDNYRVEITLEKLYV